MFVKARDGEIRKKHCIGKVVSNDCKGENGA